MKFYFGGTNNRINNHTQFLSLASSNEENITIQNPGEYELYVRCQDSNENANKNDGKDNTAFLVEQMKQQRELMESQKKESRQLRIILESEAFEIFFGVKSRPFFAKERDYHAKEKGKNHDNIGSALCEWSEAFGQHNRLTLAGRCLP